MKFLANLFKRNDAVADAPGVTTTVVNNAGGSDLYIRATADTFERLSDGVLSAVMAGYTRLANRSDFSGEVKVVILRATPEAVRSKLPSLKEKLRGVSLGSMTHGATVLRFRVQEEGGPVEVVSGVDLFRPE